MKLLIADDERHAVEAIQLLLDWNTLGFDQIFTAESVAEACELLEQENPELAIVDVVLGDRLGVEILRHIQSQGIQTKSIVISGHDDYQYTRAMFVLGALDYLLKPIVPEELESAVQKALQLIREETTVNQSSFGVDRQIKHLFPDHQHSLFRKLFQKDLREVALRELRSINANAASSQTCLVLYSSGALMPISSQNYVVALSDFLNRLQHTLENRMCGTLFQRTQPDPDVVILIYNDLEKSLELIRSSLKAFEAQTAYSCCFGSSKDAAFADGIDEAMKEAETAYYSFPMRTAELICRWTEGMWEPAPVRDKGQVEELFSALLTGDRAGSERAFEAWFQRLLQSVPETRGGIRSIWESFLQIYEKDSVDNLFQPNSHVSRSLAALCADTFRETVQNLRKEMLRLLWGLYEAKTMEPTRGWEVEVARYMEINYGERFYQQEYADRFHLNKDYMSRHFREAYGVGMVTYLNEIRIRKAKELLNTTEMQIQEIADQVGFSDVKYFSQQFKKFAGCTPTVYRTDRK